MEVVEKKKGKPMKTGIKVTGLYILTVLMAWPSMTLFQAATGMLFLFLAVFLLWPILGWFIWLPICFLAGLNRPTQKTTSHGSRVSGGRG